MNQIILDGCIQKDTKLYDEIAKKHLRGIYGANWSIEKLIYKKYK